MYFSATTYLMTISSKFIYSNKLNECLCIPFRLFGHVVLYDLNSGMHQNCPILVRTRIAGKNNSGTLQVVGLFQQFWCVLELLEQFWYVRNLLAVSNAPISNHVSIILFAQ